MVHHNGESTKSHTIAVDNGGGKEGDREKGTPSSELDDAGVAVDACTTVMGFRAASLFPPPLGHPSTGDLVVVVVVLVLFTADLSILCNARPP